MLNQYEEWMLWQWWWLACLPAWGFYDPLLRDGWNWIGAHSIAKVSIWGEERERVWMAVQTIELMASLVAPIASLSLVQLESDSMMAFNFNFVASSFYWPIGHIITYLLYLSCSDGRVRCQSVEGDYLSVMWRHHPSIDDDDDQVQSCAKAAM